MAATAVVYAVAAVVMALHLDSEGELAGAPLLALVVGSVAVGIAIGRAWATMLPLAALAVAGAVAIARNSGHDLADSLLGIAGLSLCEIVLIAAGVGLRAMARSARA